jgi:DNA-binding transcriptional MerR regulator
MKRETHAVYVISVAAEIAGVHPQTLRIYERRGLLQPARTSGGNRRYSNADIQRLQRIAELAEMGMNLEGMHYYITWAFMRHLNHVKPSALKSIFTKRKKF